MISVLWSIVGGIALAFWYFRPFAHRVDFQGKHIFISGGSSGIGRAIAVELARRGANITLASRSKEKLEEAKRAVTEAMADRSSQRCLTVPVDVTDFEAVKAAVAASVNTLGYPSHVFTAAGLSHPGYFVEQDVSVHERTMQLDYFGTLHVLKAFADMKARSPLAKELKGQEAHFVLFSSTAGMLSFVGFSSYAPAKYALRGLAETLRNELLPYKIHISIVYPPDTDTPGFAAEMEVKPEECAKISSWGGKPLDPAYVAREVVRQVSMRIFHICADPGTRLLVTATAGASPRPSLLTDVLLSPIAVLAAMGFRIAFDRVCVSGFLARERRVKLGASPAHSRSGSLSSYQ